MSAPAAASRTSPGHTLALGLDIGGTSTRALVVGLDGKRHGSGRAAGANLTSHALDDALDAISAALAGALDGLDAGQVGGAVVGTAGIGHLAVPEVADAFARRWRQAGLSCDYQIQPDALVAFVAGTAEPAGTLVLSGTGALVSRVEDRDLVHIVDGHGWLLGDLGSGFWLGLEAVRGVLAAVDRRDTPGPLGQAVLGAVVGSLDAGTGDRDLTEELVLAVHRKPPVALSALAPLVSEYAGHDPEADRILDGAADHLLRETSTVRSPGETAPLVLAGSLLATNTPLARLVRARLSAQWPDTPIATATDATAGAAWLAATTMAGLDPTAATTLHERLLGGQEVVDAQL